MDQYSIKAYNKDDIQVDPSKTAMSEKIKKQKYLQKVAEDISHSNDVKVELLIGANCTRALKLAQVIASRDGGPYAMKTVKGWYIVGPIAWINSGNGSLACNRMAVQQNC